MLTFKGRRTEDLLDVGPSGGRAAGHERGTVTGTLLTTGHTGTNELEALGLELLASADRVRVVRVAAVDDNVALLEVRLELANKVVDSLAGLDEENDSAGLLELLAELLDRVSADDVGAYNISSVSADTSGTNPWPRSPGSGQPWRWF